MAGQCDIAPALRSLRVNVRGLAFGSSDASRHVQTISAGWAASEFHFAVLSAARRPVLQDSKIKPSKSDLTSNFR